MTAFDFFAVIYYFFLALSGRSIHDYILSGILLLKKPVYNIYLVLYLKLSKFLSRQREQP
ncbi:hypothetical protein RiCNE_11350 [Rickettsia endosymbiont of Culicoides newsteadi]|nr:hypothetical protein RiCNE_11350 [Rickettsia endosymbiont of Culicoides newsteadi]